MSLVKDEDNANNNTDTIPLNHHSTIIETHLTSSYLHCDPTESSNHNNGNTQIEDVSFQDSIPSDTSTRSLKRHAFELSPDQSKVTTDYFSKNGIHLHGSNKKVIGEKQPRIGDYDHPIHSNNQTVESQISIISTVIDNLDDTTVHNNTSIDGIHSTIDNDISNGTKASRKTVNNHSPTINHHETAHTQKTETIEKSILLSLNEIVEQSNQELNFSDKNYYLLSCDWVNEAKCYLLSTTTTKNMNHPGPIQNTDLLGLIRRNSVLFLSKDFFLASQEAWEKLKSFFLVKEEYHTIQATYNSSLRMIEFSSELLSSFLFVTFKPNSKIFSKFSNTNVLSAFVPKDASSQKVQSALQFHYQKNVNIKNVVCQFQKIDSHQENSMFLTNSFLSNENDKDGAIFTVSFEVKDVDGNDDTDNEPNSIYLDNSQSTESLESKKPSLTRIQPINISTRTASPYSPTPSKQNQVSGVVGLRNLGNTCFMNSALQCLSNTAPLTKYFLSGVWKSELNPENPLGMSGQVAEAYANLIHNLWKPRDQYDGAVAPHQFKSTIGRFNSTFVGYSQQDSQELLNFLLDGLHEDLNKIKKKPYVEMPDMTGQPEESVAQKAWELYKARNDSVIVDFFQGEYKSRVVCTTCEKNSLAFDPYMFLSIPVPEKRQINVHFTLLSLKDARSNNNLISETTHRKVCLEMPKLSRVGALKTKVAQEFNLKVTNMIVVELFQSKIYKLYQDDDRVSSIMPNDTVYIIEVGPLASVNSTYPSCFQLHEETVIVPVYFTIMPTPLSTEENSSNSSSSKPFGVPLMIKIPKLISIPPNLKKSEILNVYKAFFGILRTQINDGLVNGFGIELPKENEQESGKSMYQIKIIKGKDEEDTPLARYRSYDNLGRFYHSNWTFSYGSSTVKESDLLKQAEEEAMIEETGNVTTDKEGSQTNLPKQSEASQSNTATDDYGTELNLSGEVLLVMEWPENVAAKVLKKKQEVTNYFSGEEYSVFEPKQEEDSKKDIYSSIETNSQPTVALKDCLNEHTKEELLAEEDTWYCPNCKEHRRIRKKIDIWTLPQVLVIHLKRFANERSILRSLSSDKIDCVVDFPLVDLDMSSFVQSKKQVAAGGLTYDLYAVSNHFGGLGGGHYTANAKNPIDQKWYHFDDSSVSPCQPDEVITKAAYLLFYQRQESQNFDVNSLIQGMQSMDSHLQNDIGRNGNEDVNPESSRSDSYLSQVYDSTSVQTENNTSLYEQFDMNRSEEIKSGSITPTTVIESLKEVQSEEIMNVIPNHSAEKGHPDDDIMDMFAANE